MASSLDSAPVILIALVDTDAEYRAQLAAAIQPEEHLRFMDANLPVEDFLAGTEGESPDVVLLSATDDHSETLALVERLTSSKKAIKAIVVVSLETQEFFVKAVRAGCRGILHKDSAPDLVIRCIRKVHEGEFWLDRATTAQVLRQFTNEQTTPPVRDRETRTSPLSPREREIVGLVLQGYKNRELAEKLAISEQTVKNHMHNVFDKLGVSDRLELALYVIHNRLLDSNP